MTEPTNFGKIIVDALAAMTKNGGSIDQRLLRMYLTMTPSYLVMDSSMNSEGGIASWRTGFMRLVEVLVALHKPKNEMEMEILSSILMRSKEMILLVDLDDRVECVDLRVKCVYCSSEVRELLE